jgi:hypothetical protein
MVVNPGSTNGLEVPSKLLLRDPAAFAADPAANLMNVGGEINNLQDRTKRLNNDVDYTEERTLENANAVKENAAAVSLLTGMVTSLVAALNEGGGRSGGDAFAQSLGWSSDNNYAFLRSISVGPINTQYEEDLWTARFTAHPHITASLQFLGGASARVTRAVTSLAYVEGGIAFGQAGTESEHANIEDCTDTASTALLDKCGGSIRFENLVGIGGNTATQSSITGQSKIDGGRVGLLVGYSKQTTFEFPKLTSIGGGLQIYKSASLETVDLSFVQSIGGGVYINSNLVLDTLDMSALKSIGDSFRVSSNTRIKKLDLSSIQKIHGQFYVSNNTAVGCRGSIMNAKAVAASVSPAFGNC